VNVKVQKEIKKFFYSMFVLKPSVSGNYPNFYDELRARMAFHAWLEHGRGQINDDSDDDFSDMPPLESPESTEKSQDDDDDDDDEEEGEGDGATGGVEVETTASETEK
jgi:hypothetical protein